ncbi:MAG: cytochrome c oxidase subunit II [Kiritimatiellae bacterium]|nr:cytochrome c oxidase subunit II [Kiritimatiellia bacterium]
MKSIFSLLTDSASTSASQMDAIYLFLVLVSIFVCIVVFGMSAVFVIRYRRRPGHSAVQSPEDSKLEMIVGGLLLVLVMALFGWGSRVYFHNSRPPADAMEIMVTGKQWMWKVQHPSGKREINNLTVPMGQPVKLTMTSEDVIHSFFIPAFRIKQDVLPGRYTRMWFEATKPGRYHLFCAEFCGTEHSLMGGWVDVVTPAEYEEWVKGDGAVAANETPVQTGERLFTTLGCATCHGATGSRLGPDLNDLAGSTVKLSDGTERVADDDYLRESILDSQASIVAGYPPVMPVFRGMINEDQLMQLIAYIKSLGGGASN